MNLNELNGYDVKKIIDPFTLLPVDINWIEEKYRLRKKGSGFEIDPVESSSSNKKSSTAKSRRRDREEKAEGSFASQQWEEVKSRYENKCLRCGSSNDLVPDHVQAMHVGGSNRIENIQPLCSPCNIWKGLKTIDYRPHQNTPTKQRT